MNILTDQLPDAVMIGDEEVPINSDFRPCLRTILAFEDDDLTTYEKQVVMLQNLYPTIPEDLEMACRQASKFLNGGEDGKKEEVQETVRLYSFAHDDDLIYASFRQVHGIDLETAELHWWKFTSLFMAILGTDCPYGNLVGLRKRLADGTASAEEKKAAEEMGDLIEIPQPDTRSLAQREKDQKYNQIDDDFMTRLNKGQ
jgi:hypothetical protein